jgi:riboflavin synthase
LVWFFGKQRRAGMFTGIISGLGTVLARDGGVFTVRAPYAADGIALGASIAHDGCCLTVTRIEADDSGARYTLDVSNETLSKTTLGTWGAGTVINLERALKAGDELGGHMVTGHVDGVATIAAIRADGDSRRFSIAIPAGLAAFIAAKGSVALDGTSLTINEVDRVSFGVNLIPHSLTITTWGRKQVGDKVNLEIDPLARYMARLLEFKS